MKKITSTRTNPDIPILYEDNHLLVIDKPAGVLSQEDHTGDPDVLTLCKKYIKKKYNKPGKVWLGLVHRLDRPVSGVMVIARTSKAASRLSAQIRNNKMDKTYWAMVEGMVDKKATLVHYLTKDSKSNNVSAYNSKKHGGKESKLSFIKLKQNAKYSLVEINLFTGRTHQIRVQFAKTGHPLWGDYRYGEVGSKNGKDLGLRAVKLAFDHPTQKERMTFEAPAPDKQPWNFFDY